MADITVQYKDRIRIQDLPELQSLSEPDVTYLIDTSDVSSLKTSIESFAGQNDIINKSAAKRYWTEENDLKANDLRLFSHYAQDNSDHEKKVIFEQFPIVDETPPFKNSEISTTQLLTKANINDFQSYLCKKHLNAFSCIPAYNWENEFTIDANTGEKIPTYTDISSFIDFLKEIEHDSRATYKFEYTTLSPDKINVERTTNIVPLNQFKYNDTDITAIVHYSVAGFVAVKSDLEDQRSGTIYLEARQAGDKDAEWQTIDSAVFKFIPNSREQKSPGTYVTLSGYLSTEFETRLKLNLKSHGYSMNLYEVRDQNMALTNHYVNTFIGFVHIPDAVSKNSNHIYFTNINYQSYFYKGKGFESYSAAYEPNQTIRSFDTVNDLLDFFNENLKNSNLEISSPGMTDRQNFVINGVRLTPTGEIYKLEDPITVEAGTTVYPSYTSGTITALRPTEPQSVKFDNYPITYTFARSDIMDRIDYTKLKVLEDNTWNENTKVFGTISSEISTIHDTRGTRRIVGRTEQVDEETTGTLAFGGAVISAADYATEKPRRQYSGGYYTFDFSRYLNNVRLVPGSQITCSMYIWPSTWGRGSGNESYGRVYTSQGYIVNYDVLRTKNMSAGMTKYLCTGSRWNIDAAGTSIWFTQPASQQWFTLAAYADCGSGDGKRETWFGVYANNITIQYRYISSKTVIVPPYDEPSGCISYYGADVSGYADCKVSDNSVYPTNVSDVILYYTKQYPIEHCIPDTDPPEQSDISALTNETYFNNITATNLNYIPIAGDDDYTELSVHPYPQNLVL